MVRNVHAPRVEVDDQASPTTPPATLITPRPRQRPRPAKPRERIVKREHRIDGQKGGEGGKHRGWAHHTLVA